MGHVLSLYRLQQIDSQSDRARARIQEVDVLLEDDAELRLSREREQEAQARHQAAERALRQAEMDVHNQQIKIEQTEASLYGSGAHSPKELQDLQNEAAALKRYLVVLEDRQLETMQAIEETESAWQAARAVLQTAEHSRGRQDEDLRSEREALEKGIARLGTERQAAGGALPPDVSSLYEELRRQRQGVAVASISDNSCGVCGSSLTPALVQIARSDGQPALCTSCGRILYGS